jgi:hypothetical protein
MRIIWLAVAALITVGSFAGGDLAVLSGWLFLVWTAPVGPVWWFYIYPVVKSASALAPELLQLIGSLAAIAVAYAFWFVAIPWLVRRGRGN